MRFSLRLNERILLTVATTYILYLGARGQLDLYIHPRYVIFTIAMSVIALVVLFLSGFKARRVHEHESSSFALGAIVPLLTVLGVALALPASSLTSATASQRLTDSGVLVATVDSEPLSTLFAGSSRGLSVSDWSRTLAVNTDPEFYQNRPAAFSGFVFDAGLGADHVWVSRFVLTCCAVDAQPTGVPVHIPGWADEFEQDQWLSLEGGFELQETAAGEAIVLVPSTIEVVEEPGDPYAN